MNPRRPIVLIEDSDEDFEITSAAIRLAKLQNPIIRCKTGTEATDYLSQRGRFLQAVEPAFILLDLNLPGMDWRRILAEICQSPFLSATPAIVLSTSNNPRDVRLCYQLGAAGYLVKPVDLNRFERMIQGLAEYWMQVVLLPEQEETSYAGATL